MHGQYANQRYTQLVCRPIIGILSIQAEIISSHPMDAVAAGAPQ